MVSKETKEIADNTVKNFWWSKIAFWLGILFTVCSLITLIVGSKVTGFSETSPDAFHAITIAFICLAAFVFTNFGMMETEVARAKISVRLKFVYSFFIYLALGLVLQGVFFRGDGPDVFTGHLYGAASMLLITSLMSIYLWRKSRWAVVRNDAYDEGWKQAMKDIADKAPP